MVFCKDKASPYKRDGPYSWVICFVVFCNNLILFGLLLSFGVLLPVISEQFQRSRGETAWIGSLAIGFSFLLGPVALKIISWLGERPVGMLSGLFSALAIIVSSFASDFWLLHLSYGFSFGFFGSCLINSQILTSRKYFQKKLPVAVGITSAGASIGVLTVGPVLQLLVDGLGWRGALRIMSGSMVLAGLLCSFFDPNVESNDEQSSKEKESKEKDSRLKMFCLLWRNPNYTFGTISILLAFFGLYVPMIHLVSFAKSKQITASKSSLLYIYIGILSTISRIVMGKIIERKWLTPIQGVQFSSLLIGCSLIFFSQAKLYSHFIIFAIVYGFGNGSYQVSQAVFYMTCFTDIKMASVGWTTGYVFSAVALFIGPPFAGFIADYFGSYIPTFFTFGGVVVFAGVLPFCRLCCISKPKATRFDSELIEAQSKIIGYRLANAESSLHVSFV